LPQRNLPQPVHPSTADAPATTRLLRVLGVGFGIAVVIGGTIGVGILRTPGSVLARLGSAPLAVLVWVLGGVYSLLGAVTLAELATMIPEAGGYFSYARRAFGRHVAFVVGWCDLLVYCTALAYLSIAIGEFCIALRPASVIGAKPIAVLLLTLAAALQYGGIRVSARAQEGMSALKALGFGGLAAACLLAASWPSSPPLPSPGQSMGVQLVLAFQLVIGTYGGWYSAIYFAEEDTNPAKNVPRALIAGVLCLTAIYVAINIALLAVLPLSTLASSALPAADAAAVLFGPRASQVITVLSIVSLAGIIHPVMMIGTRVLFAVVRDQRPMSRLTHVNRRGTPVFALTVVTGAGLALLLSGTFDRLFAMVAVFASCNYIGAMLTLLVLRRKEPDAPRPVRAWGYPWTVWLVLFVSAAFLCGAIVSDPLNSAAAVLLVIASWPVRWLLASKQQAAIAAP
jgi:APA family basic amino acid/polyamine antiporter